MKECEPLVFSVVDSLTNNFVNHGVQIHKKFNSPYSGSEVLFATTMDTDTWVVIKISAKTGSAEREWTGLSKTYKAGVLVPMPYALINIGGKLAVLSEKVEGKNLYYFPNNDIKYYLGQSVKNMQSRVVIEGQEWLESGKPDFKYYDKYLFYWACGENQILDAKSTTNVLLKKLADPMRIYIQDVKPVFSHGDIHDGQVIIRNNRPVLIDFEGWIEESQLNDLAYYLFHCIRTEKPMDGFINFLEGYLQNTTFTEQQKSVLLFYLLFISARAVSYFRHHKSTFLEKAELTHQKVLEYIDREEIWKNL